MRKPTEKTPYVFVYGTLMSGYSNNRLLSSSEMIDTATTEEEFTLLAHSFPYLVEEDGKSYVSGEIYKVSEDTLTNLDSLEGHPTWYERKVIKVITETGDRLEAWAYFMPKSKLNGSAKLIESGSYREYTEEKVY